MRNLVLGLVPYDGIVTGDDTGLDVDGDGFWLLDWGLIESLASLRCRIYKLYDVKAVKLTSIHIPS